MKHPKLSPELEIVRKAYESARVHPMEAAERELVRQEAERAAGSGEAVAPAHECPVSSALRLEIREELLERLRTWREAWGRLSHDGDPSPSNREVGADAAIEAIGRILDRIIPEEG